MTTETTATPTAAALEARVARILDRAITLAAERLEVVSDKELRDGMAFDRVARAALAFVRVAVEADLLLARKRKEEAANGGRIKVQWPSLDDLERLEAVDPRLVERADRASPDRGAAPYSPSPEGEGA